MVSKHYVNVFIRDIKPENILLTHPTNRHIKLADFGLAKVAKVGQSLQTFCGTPQYYAPEVNIALLAMICPLADALMKVLDCRDDLSKSYSSAVDIWSLGIVTFVMLMGRFPFSEDSFSAELSNGTLERSFGEDAVPISTLAQSFVRDLLAIDPSRRPTAQQLQSHPWFAGMIRPGLGASSTVLGKTPRLRHRMASMVTALSPKP